MRDHDKSGIMIPPLPPEWHISQPSLAANTARPWSALVTLWSHRWHRKPPESGDGTWRWQWEQQDVVFPQNPGNLEPSNSIMFKFVGPKFWAVPHIWAFRGGGIKADPKQRSSSCLYRTYTYHAEAILLRPGCKCLSSTSPETWRPMKFIAGTATGVLLKSTQL